MKSKKLSEVPFTNVKVQDKFWGGRMKTHRDVTIDACIRECEETGRISNFAKAAGIKEGKFEGIYFNDSDVYKVLEGIAYSLANCRDAKLEKKTDEIIDLIAAAQQGNGYLDTYFILTAPDKKWTDMEKHEDYCAGHLIEAGIAYYKATKKDKLLKVACNVANHMMSVLGPEKKHWVVGHEEPELALIKLYRETGNEKYLEFSKWLLEERGHGYGKGAIWDKKGWGPSYCQDDKPVKDLSHVSGHAVRAMYLYTAMADMAGETGDGEYAEALDRLWDSVVLRNMYITGGIGSTKSNEGFTEDYDLPNETAYCETCASVGMVYWNHRMNLLSGQSKYADIVEREMYNGALSGVSLSGDMFFYENPLATDGSHHRQKWYGCSCCPTQIARFIPSVGNYVYAVSDSGIWINQYFSNTGNITLNGENIKIEQKTRYPWDGDLHIKINVERPCNFSLNLRKPGWCGKFSLSVNGISKKDADMNNGYIAIERTWSNGDFIDLHMDMPVQIVHADKRVRADAGLVCLMRGPIVYCFEETDNLKLYDKIFVSSESRFKAEYMPDLLDGICRITVLGDNGMEFLAVPYYSWDNREPGKMKVWVPENTR